MRIPGLLACVFLAFSSCKKDYSAPVPDSATWAEFNSAATLAITDSARSAMEGIYSTGEGLGTFGDTLALKWNYTHVGTDTSWHFSFFGHQDIDYIICEGKRSGDDILLSGYWRKMAGVETGLVQLRITAAQGADLLAQANPVAAAGSIVISGLFGSGQDVPSHPLTLTYNRKLHRRNSFQIVAHRSGGRTSDLLPVSENSVAMILKTPEFGSTGIEIDVRLTKDGVPVIYHDNTLNLRETQKSGLVGPIENYTYDQLSTFVRLIHGEKIPTLREALDAVVFNTNLHFVWLDTKFSGSLQPERDLQREYLQKAALAGRDLRIVMGLPSEAAVNDFLALPDFKTAPNLCELTLEDVAKTNAEIWAPRFTLGVQTADVAKIHAMGKLAFVWTLDVPDLVRQYLREGDFDAILSNYPSDVAYNYYVQP